MRGHADVRTIYLKRLEEQIGGAFVGPLFSRDQLQGRVEYVCHINRQRRRTLERSFGAIHWDTVKLQAIARGLMVCKTLRRITASCV